jgi:hypothetical protein
VEALSPFSSQAEKSHISRARTIELLMEALTSQTSCHKVAPPTLPRKQPVKKSRPRLSGNTSGRTKSGAVVAEEEEEEEEEDAVEVRSARLGSHVACTNGVQDPRLDDPACVTAGKPVVFPDASRERTTSSSSSSSATSSSSAPLRRRLRLLFLLTGK